MHRNFFLETDPANAPVFLAKFPLILNDKNLFPLKKMHQTLSLPVEKSFEFPRISRRWQKRSFFLFSGPGDSSVHKINVNKYSGYKYTFAGYQELYPNKNKLNLE